MDFSFLDKKVLITGHTGLRVHGCVSFCLAGAKVTGYALEAPTDPSLFEMCRIADGMNSVVGDIRDLEHLKRYLQKYSLKL